MRRKPLVLLELNEVNFDVAERYVRRDRARFPAFARLLAQKRVTTTAEVRYDQLEPWIQWVSVHTGQAFEEHQVFRLGDIKQCASEQVFEKLESRGLTVGCISPMNAENRLKAPAFFIPDPWTDTPPDRTWWSRSVHAAVSQAVNDNAKARITPRSLAVLALAAARFALPSNYPAYLALAAGSRKAPWKKALALDLLLSDIFMRRTRASRPDFSCLFLNAGAHIQHHYFLNSVEVSKPASVSNPAWYVPAEADPFADMLDAYERVLGQLFSLRDTEMIVATGLTQQPYDRTKFYYRLRDHRAFLTRLGIGYEQVQTLMTRDFIVDFASGQQADEARRILSSVRTQGEGVSIFGEIEPRGKSLFVTLTYPDEVTASTVVEWPGGAFALQPEVVFVALKNGMHHGEGFAFFTSEVANHAPDTGTHVSGLHGAILSYFNAAHA